MPKIGDIDRWTETIRSRYENYLKTSFYFKDPELRASFQVALREEGSLLKGPFPEEPRRFQKRINARSLAQECFVGSDDLLPALIDRRLYTHQERAVRAVHYDQQNVVVATGTASGKTESFLYPILFELYQQHQSGKLREPGVRAMILYPMNALANDQRERLGKICNDLQAARSGFRPTFGQYIGQTPENRRDHWRNASAREEGRLPGEIVFREDMRREPPHILLTNYSMLEYLLIRPDDSPLFDHGRSKHWQFIVLDEAHQYRGAKGMEMGMLIRRLRQRLRDGGREGAFRCIATSATISSGQTEDDRQAVANFATELFGQPFSLPGVIFGETQVPKSEAHPRRYHLFLRALEGAFLVHTDRTDKVVLNRKGSAADGSTAAPLEIALCKECGQHYYVGRERNGRLEEAVRDPSQPDFGVEYYLPSADSDMLLCRRCGALSHSRVCDCEALTRVKQCESHPERADQLKRCEMCNYQRGGIGDPVQEIVHGSDGPNAVIATALHEVLPESRRKVLAFADSRQEAAFFAWYAQDSYEKLRDRNLIYRAMRAEPIHSEGLSIEDLMYRLLIEWESAGLFSDSDTAETRRRQVLVSVLRESLTDERRLSLSGVGLVKWSIRLPSSLELPPRLNRSPWNLSKAEGRDLAGYLLDELRRRRAMGLPKSGPAIPWKEISPWGSQYAYQRGKPRGRKTVRQWGGPQSTVVRYFLRRVLARNGLSHSKIASESTNLMRELWDTLQRRRADPILLPGKINGTFHLNPRWLRIELATVGEIWECDTCATLSVYNVAGICPRNQCTGCLSIADQALLSQNHYRILYESEALPPTLRAEEHTAQIESNEARQRQDRFKKGETHLLSSSTTFEVGVDLGDLEAVFLRNVPPEPFNYTQRVGRAGRRETPGLALTYCRRNPHDLYHYERPVSRILEGEVRPPRLRMTNAKIISRHMVATALSAFFKAAENQLRFENVNDLVTEWSEPRAVFDLRQFCESDVDLRDALRYIVPAQMHRECGLTNDGWIDVVAGLESRFAYVEAEVCADYANMESVRRTLIDEQPKDWTRRVGQIERRMNTIARERTLTFLSRKAVIPKYGFPVDVVELDTRPKNTRSAVTLQRDLSQAIAEYAPGTTVIANKLEWDSCGVRVIAGRELPVRYYRYDDARTFRQWDEVSTPSPVRDRKYVSPQFGFVVPLFYEPREPRGRSQRLYTTRPFFCGFASNEEPQTRVIVGVQVTKALPGTLVILCEGKLGKGFYICLRCGRHLTGPSKDHESPSNTKCTAPLSNMSLGYELETDIVRLDFPFGADEWQTYSLAYAVLLGAAETLDVPDRDLNVTITAGSTEDRAGIVMYDNVPGGAGLVAELDQEDTLASVLEHARARVAGGCGCDLSCYGCLRSYRNQFAHPHLDRNQALSYLSGVLG